MWVTDVGDARRWRQVRGVDDGSFCHQVAKIFCLSPTFGNRRQNNDVTNMILVIISVHLALSEVKFIWNTAF